MVDDGQLASEEEDDATERGIFGAKEAALRDFVDVGVAEQRLGEVEGEEFGQGGEEGGLVDELGQDEVVVGATQVGQFVQDGLGALSQLILLGLVCIPVPLHHSHFTIIIPFLLANKFTISPILYYLSIYIY